VKSDTLRDPTGNWLGVDGRPAAVKAFVAYSLRRLGTDWIDIWSIQIPTQHDRPIVIAPMERPACLSPR
jgi:aryl-alcohol dehydrogenase-like predicted oxidoreductase